jgi:hypothetical protein
MHGLIQLVAVGIPDLYLTGDPQISFFKVLYRRHTEFSMIDQNILISNKASLGNTYNIQIPRIADMLHKLCVRITLDPPKIKKLKPTLQNINKLLSKYDIHIDQIDNCDDILRFYDLFKTNILSNKLISKINKTNDEYNQFILELDNILDKINFTEPNFIAIHKNSLTFTPPRLINNNNNNNDNIINYDTRGYYLLNHDITIDILSGNNYIFNNCDLITDNIVYPNLNLNFTNINESTIDQESIQLLLISISDLENSKNINIDSLSMSNYDSGYFSINQDTFECLDEIIKEKSQVEVKYDSIKKNNGTIQKYCINQNANFDTNGDYYLLDISTMNDENVLGNKNDDTFLVNPCYIYSSLNYEKNIGFVNFSLNSKCIDRQIEYDNHKIENPSKITDILKITNNTFNNKLSNNNIIKLFCSYYDDLLFCESRKKEYEISNKLFSKNDIVKYIIDQLTTIIPSFTTDSNYQFIIEEINNIDEFDLIENSYNNLLLNLKNKFECFVVTNNNIYISDSLNSTIHNLDILLQFMGYEFIVTNFLQINSNIGLFNLVKNDIRTVSDFIYNYNSESFINIIFNNKKLHTRFLSYQNIIEDDLINYTYLFGKYKYNFKSDINNQINKANDNIINIHKKYSLQNIITDEINNNTIEKLILKISLNENIQDQYKNNQLVFLNNISNLLNTSECDILDNDEINNLLIEFDKNNSPELQDINLDENEIIIDETDQRKYSPLILRNISENYNCFVEVIDVIKFMMDEIINTTINGIKLNMIDDSLECVLEYYESNILERKNTLSLLVNDKFITENNSYPIYNLDLKIPEFCSEISYSKLKNNRKINSNCDNVISLSEIDERLKSLDRFDTIDTIDTTDTLDTTNIIDDDINENENYEYMPIYYGTKFYEELIDFFSGNNEYAWSKYLGYRMIERISFVVDGEEYDIKTSETLLMNDRAFVTTKQRRGMDELIGNTKDLYTFTSNKERKELYIDIPFFHSKNHGSSFSLVSTIHNDIQIQIKLRKLDECIELKSGFIENYNVKLKLLNRFIYLDNEERTRLSKNRTLNLIERSRNIDQRFLSTRQLKYKLLSSNVTNPELTIRQRYYFQDPTKYILFRVRKKGINDNLCWSESNYEQNIINRIKIQYNSRDRQEFKKNKFYQILHPYNCNINTLNKDEYFYSFSLYPKSFQPSGSDNLSLIEDISFFFELNPNVINDIDKIQIDMFSVSYNINLTMSGFSGLLFYGVR